MILLTPDWGTIPQQVTAVSATGLFVSMLGILAKLVLGKGHLANIDKADVRDHLVQEVERLTERLDIAEDKLRACDEREEALRSRLRKAEDDIAGLKRQIPEISANKLLVLEGRGEKPSEIAPESAASAPRVKRIMEGDK